MCRYRTIYYAHPKSCGRTDSEQMVLVTCSRLAQEIQKYNSAPKTDRFAPTMCSQMAVPDTKTVPVGLPCAVVQGCCKSMYPVNFPYVFVTGDVKGVLLMSVCLS